MRSIVSDLLPDIVLINESWTNDSITKSFLDIDGYDIIIRNDRLDTLKGRGGGLLIYGKAGLSINENDVSNEFNQYASVTIASKPTPLVLNFIYRSPNSDSDNNNHLNELIRSIKKSTIIIGDMNYPDINWHDGSSNGCGRQFLSASQDAFLSQLVDFPTHENNIIDLVMATNDVAVQSIEESGNLGKSHHSILRVKVSTCPLDTLSTEKVPDYSKADLAKMKLCISSIAWSDRFQSLDTFQSWNLFKEILSNAIAECIPLKARRSSTKPMWMNRNIMRVIRKKRRLWRHFKTTGAHTEYQAYLAVQKSVAKIIRAAKKKLERNLAKNMKKNPRPFYAHLNKGIRSRAQVGPLKNSDGELISDNNGMCNVFNSFFSSIFTKENDLNIPTPTRVCTGEVLSSVSINTDGIKSKIDKLKLKSGPGPDKFGPFVLKNLRDELAIPLNLIFNKSLTRGEVPDDWKCANITPIFKKGSRSCAENYRPISLTSIICKLLESLLLDGIVSHLSSLNLLNSSQHGFRRHRSCLTNLLHFLETLTLLLDEGHSVDVFYLDFSKAFDRVPPHQRLLAKLDAHGIAGDLHTWIESWLSERKQRVVLNGSCSTWSDVLSGVPQGSVLGPLLFIIYINDIDSAVDTLHCILFKFADDSKGVYTVDSINECLNLQANLNSLYQWSADWNLLFNFEKCHVLHLGTNNQQFEYNISGHRLIPVAEEKDLGVYITNTCTPSVNVNAAALKGNQILGQLMRVFTYRDRFTFIRLYKQYVRPYLECCVQAWSPWLQRDIDILEDVQRRAVRAVSGLKGSYEEKLLILKLPSLQQRRLRGDMLQTFKIVNQIDDIDPNIFFRFSSSTHRHATRLASSINEETLIAEPSYGLCYRSRSNLELRKNFFSNRVVPIWNSLPAYVKAATAVDEFKKRYDSCFL